MSDYLGKDMRKVKQEDDMNVQKADKDLDEEDIEILKIYGKGIYNDEIKKTEENIQAIQKRINALAGIRESDTGLAPRSMWNESADRRDLQNEPPLQVGRCTKIINSSTEETKYVVSLKQFAKFVVDISTDLSPTDIEEGMRVGVDRAKYQIKVTLPPRIDPSVTLMQVEEKPDVTYSDIGGCKQQIQKLKEVVELPLLHPNRFVELGVEPPKGVLLYGPPGTGKTLCARAVANRTDACFIRVIGSELVQKYIGEGARLGRAHTFKIHTRAMNVERNIRFELLARLCPNTTGAEIRSVCTEAGMFAIRARRKTATEKDFIQAVNKVVKGYAKFSATPRYMPYN
ncbi:proteasome regulatory ATPase subunit 1-like protein [Dinothrombium tinctorium]|uniref:Proteasome regulatory ATPase subunit 1-like protein n=1 Tax=Dinothrombium tinctorium TaxID=1965070 RepID=A0A3S3P8V6_9ACAR|nr:proteasome regulatory ATPase subunit 1-like protein [Dinothrombium tinctorium]